MYSISMQDFRSREQAVFSKIPGVLELRQARGAEAEKITLEYPEAAFAIHISNGIFQHDRELSLIYQEAYFGILEGEPISDLMQSFDKKTTLYVKKHEALIYTLTDAESKGHLCLEKHVKHTIQQTLLMQIYKNYDHLSGPPNEKSGK